MTLKLEMVTIDCLDPAKLAGWWAEQLDGKTHELITGEFFAVEGPDGPQLGFQKVPDPTPGKNRVHLDFMVEDVGDVEAEVARFTAAGAAEVERHQLGDNFRWVVLTDPDGNAFCVVSPYPA